MVPKVGRKTVITGIAFIFILYFQQFRMLLHLIQSQIIIKTLLARMSLQHFPTLSSTDFLNVIICLNLKA